MYICAIETGSCSMDGQRWETTHRNATRDGKTLCVCGKMHRTLWGARKCLDKLKDANDAAWLSARIHDEHGRRGGGTIKERAAADKAEKKRMAYELREMDKYEARAQEQMRQDMQDYDAQQRDR